MKIDLSKMRLHWLEDAEGNVLELENGRCATEKEKEKYCYYHSAFPCRFSHNISVYDYHPRGIQKCLINLPIIGKQFKKKLRKIYRDLGNFNTTFHAGSDCIVAMVNSGDYTLEQAIWVWINSCERCMNVLCNKYLDGKDGYEEYSAKWFNCNTKCDFCTGD